MKSIFISSTFSDFHNERDLLRNMIMPMVNKEAKEYGEYVSICDLRWGIDTSNGEDPESKVLSVCLDEIDRSRPYMLVLLGERYGYVPAKELIARETEKRGMILEDLEISITQLEIEYGAFRDTDTLAHTWFFFREYKIPAVSDADTEGLEFQYRSKLEMLKKRIRALAGDRVRFYQIEEDQVASYKKWCSIVCRCLINDFTKEWERLADLSMHEKEHYNQWNHLHEKARYLKAGMSFGDSILSCLKDSKGEDNIFLLMGKPGTGKTTCLSYICMEMEKNGVDVIPVLCGNTSLSTDEAGILRHFVWMLEKLLEVPHLENENKSSDTSSEQEVRPWNNDENKESEVESRKFQDRLYQLYMLYEQTGRELFLAVDAIDQLFGLGDIRNLCFLPRTKYNHLHIFLTTANITDHVNGMCCLRIPELSQEEKKQVIDSALNGQGKQLSQVVYHALSGKKGSDNPLYLYLAANQLCLMNQNDYEAIGQFSDFMDGVNHFQLEMIDHFPEHLNQMAAETIKKSALFLKNEAALRCVELMAVSRWGLRITDMEQILKSEGLDFIPVEFSRLIHFMNELYMIRLDGRYDFLHRSAREGILTSLTETKCIHREIAEYFLSLPIDDAIRQQELAFHLIQAGMEHEFIREVGRIMSRNSPEREYFQECLFQKCMEDKGAWLLGLIEHFWNDEIQDKEVSESAPYESDLFSLLYGFEIYCRHFFVENRTGLLIYHEILHNLVDILLVIGEKVKDQGNWRHILSLGYSKMADNLTTLDTPDTLKDAEQCLDKVIHIREGELQKERNVFNAAELAIAYMDKGTWLVDRGNSDAFLEAEKMFKRALYYLQAVLDIAPEEGYIRNEAILCSRIGNLFFRKKSMTDIQTALKWYRKSEKILRNLVSTNPSTQNYTDLSQVLCRIASALIVLEDNENIRLAIQLYQEAYERILLAYSHHYSVECVDELTDINYKLAFAYTLLDDQQSLLYAFQTYEKAFALADEAIKKRGLSSNYRLLIAICNGISTVSLRLSENTYLEKARGYAHIASGYARVMVETNRTMENISIFLRSLMQEGKVYEHAATDAALKEAEHLYSEAMSWAEELEAAKYHASDTNDDVAEITEKMGELFEERGGILNFRKALALYQKALAGYESTMKRYGTSPDRERNIEISCNRIGTVLMRIGERDSLTKAKEYIERALKIAISLAERVEYDKYQWDLSFCDNLFADLLMRMGNDNGDAIQYYLNAFEIRKALNEKRTTISSRETLAVSYERLFSFYSQKENFSDQQKAITFVEKLCSLREEILKEEKTVESKRNLANALTMAGRHFARLALTDSRYAVTAQESLEKCIEFWEEISPEIQTYASYMEYIHALKYSAEFAIRLQQFDKAEEYFDRMIQLAETFLETEPADYYKTMLPDIYMEICSYYESREDMDYTKERLFLNQKALAIYESVELPEKRNLCLSNMSGFCYSIACIYRRWGQDEDARHFFEKSIALTLQIPYSERNQYRIVCLYSSYEMLSEIYYKQGNVERCIFYMKSAFECEEEALQHIKEHNSIVEITEDAKNDALLLGDIYNSIGEKSLAVEYYNKGLDLLNSLLKIFQGDRDYEIEMIQLCVKLYPLKMALGKQEEAWTCIKISLGLAKKYPEFDELFQQLSGNYGVEIEIEKEESTDTKQNAMELFEYAEFCLTNGKIPIAARKFREFLDYLEQIPSESWTDQLYIYKYSAYSHLAVLYINKNTQKDYKKSLEYYRLAIQSEREALNFVKEARKLEVQNDMLEDCAYAISLCHKIGNFEEEDALYGVSINILLSLSKTSPDEFEPILARKAMEYAGFKMSVMHGGEDIGSLLQIAFLLSQKHPELSDLKKILEELVSEL